MRKLLGEGFSMRPHTDYLLSDALRHKYISSLKVQIEAASEILEVGRAYC